MRTEKFGVYSPINLDESRSGDLEAVRDRVSLRGPRSLEFGGSHRMTVMECGVVPKLPMHHAEAGYHLGDLALNLSDVWSDYGSPHLELGLLDVMGRGSLVVKLAGSRLPDDLHDTTRSFIASYGELPNDVGRDFMPHLTIGRGPNALSLSSDPGFRREIIDIIGPDVALSPLMIYYHLAGRGGMADASVEELAIAAMAEEEREFAAWSEAEDMSLYGMAAGV